MTKISKLSERGLILRLLDERTQFWNAFRFALVEADLDPQHEKKFECHLSVLRSELGLKIGQKPGDIDILIVPLVGEERLVAHCAAIEVKKLPIPIHNRGRSPSSFGRSQAIGASADGFPFVGLLHIAVVERAPESQFVDIPIVGTVEAGKWLTPKEIAAQNKGERIPTDPHFQNTIWRTNGRFEEFDLPVHIGFHSHVIQTDLSGDHIEYTSVISGRSAKENPQISKSLIDRLERLERKPDRIITL